MSKPKHATPQATRTDILMFCDYCRRLFEFKQQVEPYTPPTKRALVQGTENGVPQLEIKSPSSTSYAFAAQSQIKVYEDFKDVFTPPLLWWKVPIGQNGLRMGDIHTPRADCQICDMIFSNVSSSFVEALLSKENDVGFVYQLKGHHKSHDKGRDRERTTRIVPEATLSVWLESGKQLLPMIKLSIVAQGYAEKLPAVLPSSVQSTYTGSAETLSLASSWIRQCNVSHRRCLGLKLVNPCLPTRLIDVGTLDGKIKPHLWIPEKESEFVPYMTLSYRWGKVPKTVLTQASLTELCKHIPIDNLSKSNQDAVQITRYLGIRYLWIDALCIIQDLDGDWHAESAKMGNIYKNSYCTISASQALTGNQGCFVTHQPFQTHFGSPRLNLQSPPKRKLPKKSSLVTNTTRYDTDVAGHRLKKLKCESALSSTYESTQLHSNVDSTSGPDQTDEEDSDQTLVEEQDPKAAKRLARNSKDRRIHRDAEDVQDRLQSFSKSAFTIRTFQTDLWTSEVDSSPLSRRAWAFQERLLSPRILHFAKSQLFWECQTHKACETWPKPVVRGVADGADPSSGDNMLKTKKNLDLRGPVFDPVYEHWDEVVEFYTDAVLTRPGDKLVAISGLADEALRDNEDRYCAGLWRNDFGRNLLWYVQTPQKDTAPRSYIAPSWSWASIDGKVVHLARKPMTEYPQTLMASTIETVYTRGCDGQRWSTGQIKDSLCRISGPLLEVAGYQKVEKCQYLFYLGEYLSNSQCSLDFFPDTYINPMERSIPKNLSCLPILYHGASPGCEVNDGDRSGYLSGLVLQSIGDFRDEYRRVGVFRVSGDSGRALFSQLETREITIE